jgi:hypothetical protein
LNYDVLRPVRDDPEILLTRGHAVAHLLNERMYQGNAIEETLSLFVPPMCLRRSRRNVEKWKNEIPM